MPTITSFHLLNRLRDFSIELAAAARIFTAEQVGRHPDLSWRTQPDRRAREILNQHEQIFERLPGPYGKPFRWRLSKQARRIRGIRQTPIDPMTQRAEHWLGVGDMWLALTFYGGRPEEWRTELDLQFDVYFIWREQPYLLEYQRTPITTRQWKAKWEKRIKWYKAQEWDTKPRVVLVNVTGQQDDTLCLPRGTIHVRSIEELPNKLMRPPQ